MAQYKTTNINSVFWAMNDGFKVGRDPMGIQNSSIATYSCLLPGMTNLTGHIRYYSLYCWLLKEYDDLEKQIKAKIPKYDFIRRAELIMAFIMMDKNVNAVIGSNFISQKRYTIDDDDIYDIKMGADYANTDKYWRYKTGAFGQYYLGSLIYYKLMEIKGDTFYLLNRGNEIAQSVINSVETSVRKCMINCIITGKLSESDICNLQPFGLRAVNINSDEWRELNNLLTMIDITGSSFRRDSIYLMLTDFSKGIQLNKFVENRFISHQNDNEAAFGWYFYYLCEALHYGIESVFCHVLTTIDNLYTKHLQNPHIELLLDEATNAIIDELNDDERYDNCIETVDEWLEFSDHTIVDVLSEVKNAVNEKEYAKAMEKSLILFMCLYKELKNNEKAIIQFEIRNGLRRQRGIFSTGLNDYVGRHIKLNIKAYITTLIRQVMNEHTVVAVAKMGNSNVDLRKFIIEDSRAVLVEVRYPNETNPRIASLYNFLIDLNYITTDNELTSIAQNFIHQYGTE